MSWVACHASSYAEFESFQVDFRIFGDLKKLMSISLALLLLLGNIGLTVGTHFCGGHAVASEMMIGEKHLDCGMGMMDMSSHGDEGTHFSKSCCENQYVSIESEELFKQELSEKVAPVFVAVAVAKFLFSFDVERNFQQLGFKDTSPPLPDQDIQVLHQVFRI